MILTSGCFQLSLPPHDETRGVGEPGGIGWSEVQMHLRTPIQKVVELPCLIGREVVGSHVNFAARLVDDDIRQERDELADVCRIVSGSGLSSATGTAQGRAS